MEELSLKNKIVIVTGGNGFLGKHLVQELQKEHPKKLVVPSSNEYDLRKSDACAKLFRGADVVIHLAANVGGIGYNQEHPAELFYDNMLMGVHAMHESWKAGVQKFVALGTICAYPKFTPVPFREEDIWNGYPEETNAPYGLAKKMLLVQAQAYRKQYGFNAIFLLPTNLYGPGDKFDPKVSHVIPALIKKFCDAKERGERKVMIWGTGTPTREFLYVKDAARGIVLATKRYNKSEPVNLGSNFEISISKLAELIASIVGYDGKIEFDSTKPDGQPRRKIDVHRAGKEFGFKSEITFEEGLRETIAWYNSRNGIDKQK